MRHPHKIFDHMQSCVILTLNHVYSGGSVGQEQFVLKRWLESLGEDELGHLLSVHGYASHILKHCELALKQLEDNSRITRINLDEED